MGAPCAEGGGGKRSPASLGRLPTEGNGALEPISRLQQAAALEWRQPRRQCVVMCI